MSSKPGVSRRNFMRSAAAVAAAPAAVAATTATASADTADVLVAATVVRASHSRTARGALKIGVRASVLADGFSKENIVVAVDGVRFGASADVTRKMITDAVRARVSTELAESGAAVPNERIAVQVFGGVL